MQGCARQGPFKEGILKSYLPFSNRYISSCHRAIVVVFVSGRDTFGPQRPGEAEARHRMWG